MTFAEAIAILHLRPDDSGALAELHEAFSRVSKWPGVVDEFRHDAAADAEARFKANLLLGKIPVDLPETYLATMVRNRSIDLLWRRRREEGAKPPTPPPQPPESVPTREDLSLLDRVYAIARRRRSRSVDHLERAWRQVLEIQFGGAKLRDVVIRDEGLDPGSPTFQADLSLALERSYKAHQRLRVDFAEAVDLMTRKTGHDAVPPEEIALLREMILGLRYHRPRRGRST